MINDFEHWYYRALADIIANGEDITDDYGNRIVEITGRTFTMSLKAFVPVLKTNYIEWSQDLTDLIDRIKSEKQLSGMLDAALLTRTAGGRFGGYIYSVNNEPNYGVSFNTINGKFNASILVFRASMELIPDIVFKLYALAMVMAKNLDDLEPGTMTILFDSLHALYDNAELLNTCMDRYNNLCKADITCTKFDATYFPGPEITPEIINANPKIWFDYKKKITELKASDFKLKYYDAFDRINFHSSDTTTVEEGSADGNEEKETSTAEEG